MKFIFIFSILFSTHSYAINCEWWQTKYSAAIVDKHPRQRSTVRQHPRKEYCRNKWKNADTYIKQFKNEPIPGWSNKGEIFTKWKQAEIQIVIEILPKLPAWTEIENYSFRRANKSIHDGNPATSELTQRSIILYDLFFKHPNKLSAIGHEASHFIFPKLSPGDLGEFETLSGWDIEIKNDKVYVLPPKDPLKPDSVINKEEDFTNYMEFYISSPNQLKKRNPKMYDFLSKRYPL
jgi:hypothetical protein